jgi:alkylation response protein AidB-like acyl-CoA dehydrogenase
MLFQLPEELQERQVELREFMDKEIRPIADKRDQGGPLSKDELKDIFAKISKAGYILSWLPEEWGGTNKGFLEHVIMAEEMCRVWPALSATVDTHAGCLGILARAAPEEMKKRIVPGGITGDVIACDMVSEPQAGSDTRSFATTAILDGDHYIVNGQKIWQTNGPWADVGILTAISDPEAYAKNPREGALSLAIEKSSGWKVRDLPFIGLEAGMTGHFVFENARVPKENVLRPTGMGYQQALIVRGWARVNVAAQGLGVMQAALEDSIEWCKKRIAFGRQIGAFQLVQEMIADMATDLAASRLLTYKAAAMMDAGIRCDLEQSMCKAFATEVVKRVTDKAIQIHGARGLTTQEGFRLERYYRDAVVGQIAEGTLQITKLVMGRRLLGLSAIA